MKSHGLLVLFGRETGRLPGKVGLTPIVIYLEFAKIALPLAYF